MPKPKKLSASKIPADFFSVKSKPLPAETAKRLSSAAEVANERIAYNNQVYASSNNHASSYATK